MKRLFILILAVALILTACTITPALTIDSSSSEPPGSTSTSTSESLSLVSNSTTLPSEAPETSQPSLPAGQYYFDVDSKHWASETINAFAEEGVYFQSDMDAKLFQPNDNMTRATLVYGLAKAMHQNVSGTSLEAPFTDLGPANPECIPYIHWAYAHKIVSGTSETTFNPNGEITRQDLLTILGRYLSIAELALPKSTAKITQFTDHADISDYAYEHVTLMQKAGIVNGYPDGSFGPKKPVSRAEAAKILWNFAASVKPVTEVKDPATADKKPVAPTPTPTPQPTPTPTPKPDPTPTPTPKPEPTPTPTPPPDPKPSDSKYPQLSGPKVLWDESIYQEIMDFATTKDGVVSKMVIGKDSVVIYLGSKWPVMKYEKIEFSSSGLFSSTHSWNNWKEEWIDEGTVEIISPASIQNANTIYVIAAQAYYDLYKDREPWASNPVGLKFPWE